MIKCNCKNINISDNNHMILGDHEKHLAFWRFPFVGQCQVSDPVGTTALKLDAVALSHCYATRRKTKQCMSVCGMCAPTGISS